MCLSWSQITWKRSQKSWFRKFRRVMRFSAMKKGVFLHWTQFHMSTSKNLSPMLAGRRGCRLCRCLTDFPVQRCKTRNWKRKRCQRKSVGILWKKRCKQLSFSICSKHSAKQFSMIQTTILQVDHATLHSFYRETTGMSRISVFQNNPGGCSVAGVAVVAGLRKSSEFVKTLWTL